MDNFAIIDYIGAHDGVLVFFFLNKAKQNNTSGKILRPTPLQRTQMSKWKKILASVIST